jgi:ubiquinone/menaquinone biosynthesis C-methylase UbiE
MDYLDRLSALLYDPFLSRGERRGMRNRRAALLGGARGRVLEIGAGTGLNVEHYPVDLDELVLAEPIAAMADVLRRRLETAGRTATVVEAPAERLPFPDASFDTVVSTMVLCTVEDPHAAVGEIARVLRPGGSLLFVEHVRSTESPRLARWQDRLEAPWGVLAAGCHPNRDTLGLLRQSSLRVEPVDDGRWDGMPAIVRPLVSGRAVAQRADLPTSG